MAGISTESGFLGFHGLHGDRRFALRRIADTSGGGFPWLTASKLPALILHTPHGTNEKFEEPTPSHVRMPDGRSVALNGDTLRESISEQHGSPVEIMKFKHGIFDDACVSVI